MKLFAPDQVKGVFRGFSSGGMEFHADLVLRYESELQTMPMHGQFLLVQLESEDEAVLGRITSVYSEGRLASSAGEDYGLRAVAEDRPIPEDLREQYLKYRVDMRVLGVLRVTGQSLVFAPSHRRLPHVGSKVAFLSPEVLQEVAGHNAPGAELGFLALGEFVFAGADTRLKRQPWMRVVRTAVLPRFDVRQIVSRRSVVFARAGFGKSNLIKLLFSDLYSTKPTVEKRGGRQVPVGTIVFDPDGEYFWPDDKGRPGLCDIPDLRDQVVVFTSKEAPSPFYGSFVVGGVKLDIRRLSPAHVISIALPPEKQEQQNVQKLRGLSMTDWQALVDEIWRERNNADPGLIRQLLKLDERQEAEMLAARGNMTRVVAMLHDPASQMIDLLFRALSDGKLCVVDVSQMRGSPALALSGLLLRRIFDHNQEEFTKALPATIPTIAVVEEAQSVLSNVGTSGESAYVEWVKEGRKYDLGAVLVTQQPGSIPQEVLSQVDNWFVFHLLSSGDLQAVKRANAHFSDDLLSSLLNEPIPGHGVFWSSVAGKSYPLSVRVLSFEDAYSVQDRTYSKPAIETYASRLRGQFSSYERPPTVGVGISEGELLTDSGRDRYREAKDTAIKALAEDDEMRERLKGDGRPWKAVQVSLAEHLPETLSDRDTVAYHLVREAMDQLYGKGGWHTERRESRTRVGYMTTWVVASPGDQPDLF